MKTRTKISLWVAGVILLSGLFAVDLASHGPFWEFAWSVTGEEEPIAQLRGVPQWLMSQTRARPDTASLTPIDHTGENPYGINTFLDQEVEGPKIEAMLRMIADAGFTWIRQEFPWEDIELDGRGQFTDTRWDYDGDGTLDTINAWDKYDRIVDLASTYGLRIQARLDNPPAWAHANPDIGAFAPPDDLQDFVNFAVEVAHHFEGRVYHYQIWNEPNIYPEWGNQLADPETYTEMLCRTYVALKAVDPEIVVISAALAPTVAMDGVNLNDFIYLQRMYDAGAGNCFDVMSAQGYGLFSGPTDRRMRPTTVNVGRHLYIRDIMVANGDAHKPIWISEAAWNFVPPPAEAPDINEPRDQYGQVTVEQAAHYITQYYQRAQEEWPWIGIINYWYFTRKDPFESNQPMYYFRMVEPDYHPEDHPTFTPLPVYEAMKEYIDSHFPLLYPGVHQADHHWAIDAIDASVVEADGAEFHRAIETADVSFTMRGTDVLLRWQGESITVMACDGVPHQFAAAVDNGWNITRIYQDNSAKNRSVHITSSTPIIVDSITVLDRTAENRVPYFVAGFAAVFMLALAVWNGLRERQT